MNRHERRGSSPLQIYLHDLEATPLLEAQQERELAGRIAAGDPAARDHLARANLRLVVALARGYLGRGLSLEDLVAEGNLGLMRAVEAYDGRPGVRFQTYAAFWIKQAMQAALLKHGRPLRLPAHVGQLMTRWRRAARTLTEQLGREPTAEEVGGALVLPPGKLALVRAALRVLASGGQAPGVDEAAGAEALAELVDERTGPVAEALAEAEARGRVLDRLAALEERERTILRKRYGLDDEPPRTLAAVGARLGMTRERVRKLEKQALERLRAEA